MITIFNQYKIPEGVKPEISSFSHSNEFIDMKMKIEKIVGASVNSPINAVEIILENWDKFSDNPDTYKFLSLTIKREKKYSPIEPKQVFKILRDIESLVIMQYIKN